MRSELLPLLPECLFDEVLHLVKQQSFCIAVHDLFKLLPLDVQKEFLAARVSLLTDSQLVNFVGRQNLERQAVESLSGSTASKSDSVSSCAYALPDPPMSASNIVLHQNEDDTGDTMDSVRDCTSESAPTDSTRDLDDESVVTSIGITKPRKLRAAFEKVRHQVIRHLMGMDILYPKVCQQKDCRLCVSWGFTSKFTPCSSKYNCVKPCNTYGWYPHATKKGLSLLEKYHRQHRQIHGIIYDTVAPDEMPCVLDPQNVEIADRALEEVAPAKRKEFEAMSLILAGMREQHITCLLYTSDAADE